MYDIIEILHGLAIVGLMVTLPPLIALAVYYAVVDIDLHDSIRRLPTTLLYLAADLARRPALAHLPVNSEPRTLSDAARDAQAREWFTTAEQRAVRRLPKRGHGGAHRAGTGTPASELIAQCRAARGLALTREATA